MSETEVAEYRCLLEYSDKLFVVHESKDKELTFKTGNEFEGDGVTAILSLESVIRLRDDLTKYINDKPMREISK